MEKEQIYRQLNTAETYRSQLKATGPDIVATFIKITSKIDFFEMSPIVKKALEMAMDKNPVLKCKIIEDSDDKMKFYFAFLSPEKLESISKFLCYKSSTNDGDENVKNLFESELNIPFQAGEPLWRIRVIKEDIGNGNFNNYIFILGHHSITDGLNTFALFLKLLTSLGSSKNIETTEIEALPEEINENIRALSSLDHEDTFTVKPIPCLKRPTKRYSIKPITDGIFLTINNETYASAKDINRNLDEYKVRTKKFKINEPLWNAISEQSKNRRIRLTCIFDLVTALALKQVIKSFSSVETDTCVKSGITVNLRPHLGIPNEKMGIWLSHCENEHDQEVDYLLNCDSTSLHEAFWQITKENSDRLEEFAKPDNALICYEEQQSIYRYIILNQDILQTENVKKTYYLTYINHEKIIGSNLKYFDLTEYYAGGYHQDKNKKNLASNFISGLKNSFYWTILYKTDNLSVETVDLWASNIQNILQKIFLF